VNTLPREVEFVRAKELTLASASSLPANQCGSGSQFSYSVVASQILPYIHPFSSQSHYHCRSSLSLHSLGLQSLTSPSLFFSFPDLPFRSLVHHTQYPTNLTQILPCSPSTSAVGKRLAPPRPPPPPPSLTRYLHSSTFPDFFPLNLIRILF
jgi:hypothetical protein